MYERFGKVCGKHIGHFMLSALIVAVVCALTGCQNLMHKSVGMDNSVTAFKITLGDAQTYFIPQVILGNGRSVIVDMPMQEGSETCYYSEEAGTFTSSITRKTFIYMKAGSGVIKGHIKVETETDTIIDIPIFKMYNPMGIK